VADTAIFDVDGTLVDNNYLHVVALYHAFRRYDITLPMWRLHRAMGTGGDHIMAHVGGDEAERQHGSARREAWVEEFDKVIDEVLPLDGAHDLIEAVKSRGFRVVLASSGKSEHVEHYVDLLGIRSLADAWTSSADVENSKPEPDLVATALDKVHGTSGVMIGDSTWDTHAATGAPGHREWLGEPDVQVVAELRHEFRGSLTRVPFARPRDG
jgi:HAD superfamily hydrolase (TIGR01549 family)